MNRRTKWVLGVTVALITVASLRITRGHHPWHQHGQNHESCENHRHKRSDWGKEKSHVTPQKNENQPTN